MNIPEQLKDMKFCRVRFKTKKPFENDWTNKPYTYAEISQYFPTENYGILTGINGLGVVDDDTLDTKLLNILKENFGLSFMVRKHYYIKFNGWDGTKIIFYDTDGKHLGELQGLGQMVVGAGSTHPSGETYDIKDNSQIVELNFKSFKDIMQQYIPKPKVITIKEVTKTSWSGDDIKNIPITSIISLSGLRDMNGGNYQGPHPLHGSTTGMNFRIDTCNNTWYCFRCHSGGGPSELIAVMENIIFCNQAHSSCFTKEQGQELIQIAREKYGLKIPEKQETLSPRGWACSINIKSMAQRYNFLNCHICNTPFQFNEKLGRFACPSCKSEGVLKQFALLCAKKKLQEKVL